jgi:site-specific DNA-methyltransferase (adenine-specific)
MKEFDKAGILKSDYNPKAKPKQYKGGSFGGGFVPSDNVSGYGDKGSAARFFYCSKPSTKERNMGCDELEEKELSDTGQIGRRCKLCGFTKLQGQPNSPICECENPEWENTKSKNHHPTIKSVKLMNYLITLITPENGIVLDPFMGSGSTGVAALLSNKKFIGIEKEEDYLNIAEARIKSFEKYRQFLK